MQVKDKLLEDGFFAQLDFVDRTFQKYQEINAYIQTNIVSYLDPYHSRWFCIDKYFLLYIFYI